MSVVSRIPTRALVVAWVFLAACVSCAPLPQRAPTTCEWVRAAVKDGSMSFDWANAWYPECRPYTRPSP